jgi:RecB family exonuclease
MQNFENIRLSVSKTKTYIDCKKKFEFAYILKLPRKEWDFHTFGKFCHKVLEDFHNVYIQGSDKPYHEVMTACYRTAMVEYKPKMTKEARDECWEIIGHYLKIISADKSKQLVSSVIACEKGFELLVNGNILLNGSIDRIQIDGDNVLHVCDYKTVKNKKYIKDDWFQLLTYAYVLMKEDPALEKIRASYILLRYGFEYITVEFTKEQILAIEDKYIDYAQKMLTETNFTPTPSPLCRFCDFLDSCPEGKKNTYRKMTYGEVSW